MATHTSYFTNDSIVFFKDLEPEKAIAYLTKIKNSVTELIDDLEQGKRPFTAFEAPKQAPKITFDFFDNEVK